MLDVFVYLPNQPADEPWVWVCTCPKADYGEIIAACEVLYPTLLGIQILPIDGET